MPASAGEKEAAHREAPRESGPELGGKGRLLLGHTKSLRPRPKVVESERGSGRPDGHSTPRPYARAERSVRGAFACEEVFTCSGLAVESVIHGDLETMQPRVQEVDRDEPIATTEVQDSAAQVLDEAPARSKSPGVEDSDVAWRRP